MHEENLGSDQSNAQKRQKTIVITLIVAASLCISLVSIREGNSSNSPSGPIQKKPLNAKKTSYFSSKKDHFEDEDDDYQIKQLKEHNANQAAKIRSLRNELLERNKNLHEIKADLFKQIGDPRDKERIAEVTQLLSEKEREVDLLLQQIQLRKAETEDVQKKISHLEITRTALLEMMEAQQRSKDQELNLLKQELEKYTGTASLSHDHLVKKTLSLEATQQHFSEIIEQKAETITALENELDLQKEILGSKGNELQSALEAYALSKNEYIQNIIDLVAAIEFQMTATAINEKNQLEVLNEKITLNSQLLKQLDLEHATQDQLSTELVELGRINSSRLADILTALETEIAKGQLSNNELEKLREQHAVALFAASETEEKQQQLSQELEDLRTLTLDYELQLNLLQEAQEQNQNKYQARFSELATAYDQAQAIVLEVREALQNEKAYLATLQTEVEAIAYAHEKSQEDVRSLEEQLQSESAKRLELEERLLAKHQEAEAFQKETQTLHEETQILNNALQEKTTHNENLQSKLEGVGELIASHSNSLLEAEATIRELQQKLLAAETQNQELSQELLSNAEEISELRNSLKQLATHSDYIEKALNDAQDFQSENERLQTALLAKQQELSEAHEELRNHSEALMQKQTMIKTLMQAENTMRAEFEQQIALIRDELEAERKKHSGNQDQINALLEEYELEHQKIIGLEKDLLEAISWED